MDWMQELEKILNNVSLDKSASLISAIDKADQLKEGFDVTLKIGVLRNYTIEGIEPYLKYHLYKSGIKAEVHFGNYDMILQEVMDPESHFSKNKPDLIILSLKLESFLPDYETGNWNFHDVRGQLSELLIQVMNNVSGPLVINNFISPFYSMNGIIGDVAENSNQRRIQRLNSFIEDFAAKNSSQVMLANWERIIRKLGEELSIDYRFWYSSKSPFKKDFLNEYAKVVANIGKILAGKVKKCLVLDCDNTLWGGIIGEDGMDGIKLDNHEFPGKVYYDFQKSILLLAERGILITLCSKNNEEDVMDVLENHPHSLIKRKHLAAWRVNWKNKAENIISLSEDLNLGLDSFVFVDDSEIECDLVKKMVPEVDVLQVPKKIYLLPSLLMTHGQLDTLTETNEDRQRTILYQTDAKRKEASKSFATIDEYLYSLDLHAKIHLVEDQEVARVAQLTQKTNQFNLTTKRYTEQDIQQFGKLTDNAVLSLTVQDRFGSSGLTGVLIAKKENSTGYIDSLLLSCRVLGRKLEYAFVDYCLKYLEGQWSIAKWMAEYMPTKKNAQVANFWSEMGFQIVEQQEKKSIYFLDGSPQQIIDTTFIKINE